jgi:twitching motility two-component system response regulator PilH
MEHERSSHAGGRATPEQMDRKHVFVLNGSPEFLDIIRELLQDEHYNVTTTNFVPRSYEAIEAARPSLLVVDLVLGEQAGWDLLAHVRRSASTRDIPVMLISTSARLLEQAKAQRETFGGNCFFVKPFDLEEFLELIGMLIGKA